MPVGTDLDPIRLTDGRGAVASGSENCTIRAEPEAERLPYGIPSRMVMPYGTRTCKNTVYLQ